MVQDEKNVLKDVLILLVIIFSNVFFPLLVFVSPVFATSYTWADAAARVGMFTSLTPPVTCIFNYNPSSGSTMSYYCSGEWVDINQSSVDSLSTSARNALIASSGGSTPIDANGNITTSDGGTVDVTTLDYSPPPPTPPPSLETAMTGIVSGDLYDQNGQVYAHIAPGDLAGVPDANVSCTASDASTTACVYVAPSGASYTTYLPTGVATGSSNVETALRDLYQTARAMPGTVNTWDSRDIDLQNAVLGFGTSEGHHYAISESGGYVLGVAESTNGSSEVVIDLYSTPSKMNAYGQYNPSTDMEEKLITMSFGRGSMTENYTVNNVNTGQVQTVDNTVGAIQTLSSMPAVSAVAGSLNYYVTPSTVTAVNPATGQTVGKVNLSGQTLTPYRVERVVEAINSNPASVHGGSAVSGSAPGVNSGNVGANTSTIAGSLPTGPATQAGSGSGTNQTGPDGFYKSQYPEGTTLQTLYASHLATIQGLPFVAGLNGFKPTFGSAGLPQMCFTLVKFPGNYCLDFGHYAFVFDAIKAIVLISAVYRAYSIIIVKRT